MQILLTAFATVIGGAITFALGQMVVRGAIEPALELKRLIGTIAFDLDFHGTKDTWKEGEEGAQWHDRFYAHACALREKLNLIIWYPFFERILRLPSAVDVLEASRELTFQANRGRLEEWTKSHAPNIKKLLHIKT